MGWSVPADSCVGGLRRARVRVAWGRCLPGNGHQGRRVGQVFAGQLRGEEHAHLKGFHAIVPPLVTIISPSFDHHLTII